MTNREADELIRQSEKFVRRAKWAVALIIVNIILLLIRILGHP